MHSAGTVIACMLLGSVFGGTFWGLLQYLRYSQPGTSMPAIFGEAVILTVGALVLIAALINPDYKYRCPRCKRGTDKLQWQPFLGGDVCNICVEMNKDEINEHYRQLNRISEEINMSKDIVNDSKFSAEIREIYRNRLRELERSRLKILMGKDYDEKYPDLRHL